MTEKDPLTEAALDVFCPYCWLRVSKDQIRRWRIADSEDGISCRRCDKVSHILDW